MTIQPLYDLAGSSFLKLPSGLSDLELSNLIKNNQDKIFGRLNPVKIIFDSYDIKLVNSLFEKTSSYNTNFFALERSSLIKAQFSSDFSKTLSEFESNFETIELSQVNSKKIKPIIKNLVINSFAIKFEKINNSIITLPNKTKTEYIQKYFDTDIENVKTFLVLDKIGNIVGCYSLSKTDGETQLSAVAGRSNLPNIYKNGKKLPVLMCSVIKEFSHNIFFEQTATLTFSNSKSQVAQIYSDLGFTKNSIRKGIIATKLKNP